MVNWSYSALKDYEGCARRYHVMRILKQYPRQDTEQSLYGDRLHKAAEVYTKTGVMDNEFQFMAPIIDALKTKPGEVFAEHKMALTADLVPCTWYDRNTWVRAIADFMVIDREEHVAWVVDYKSGKAGRPDLEQLDVLSLLVFEHFPDVVQVNSALIFVLHDVFVKHKRYITEKENLWWKYRQRVACIEQSKASGTWNPAPSGLCRKHCAVLHCEHNGRS